MLIDFTLSDIIELTDDHWPSSDLDEDENYYFVFSVHSDTALFLITKIIHSFQYEILTTYEMSNGDTAYITNIKYRNVVSSNVICSECQNELCNRDFSDNDEPQDD
jgi:hypothetical protein